METINGILNEIGTLVSELLSNIFLSGLFGSILGLVLGILLARYCSRKGIFNRSNAFWTFIAKLNYVLLPLAFLLVGMTQGAIYGAHDTADEWIDNTTRPIVDYAEFYLPEMQMFCNTYMLGKDPNEITIEELVEAKNRQQADGFSGDVATSFNILLLESLLDVTAKGPAETVAPLVMLSQVDIENLQRKDFEILPLSLKAVASFYFAGFYWAFFAPFGVYFLIAIGEIMLYRFIRNQSEGETYEERFTPEYV